MIELFAPWVALQEQAIELQRRQIGEWAANVVPNAGEVAEMQHAAQAAVEANVKAAASWLSLWGFRDQ